MNFKNAMRRFLNVYFQEWEAFICSMPTTSTSPTWTQNTQLWMGNCQSSVIYMPWTSAIRRTLKKQLRQGLKVHVILVSAWDHFNASRNLCNLKMLMLVNWGGCCCPLSCAVGLWSRGRFYFVFSQLGLSLTFYTFHNLITIALFWKGTWHTFIGWYTFWKIWSNISKLKLYLWNVYEG